MKRVFFAIITLISLIMVSCESNKQSDFKPVSTSRIKSVVLPSNSSNAYDYIGQLHNDSLYVLVTTSDPSKISKEYIYNRYYSTGISFTLEQVESILSQVAIDPKDYTGYMKTLYDNNQAVMPALNDVLEIVNSDSSLQSKVSQIISYENSYNFSSHSQNHVIALKAMFSVARHSMVLWATEEQGGVDLSSKGKQLKVNYIGGNPRTHAIVTADIWGALGGALTGGPGSALVGAIWGSGIEWMTS